ncbi:MAG TPA: flagellar basal body-associated FliL family protein [Dongiaceae bacterium]|jgi:flagellar FliL protein|nr:flagellar basal body-associated FliL family protein [Dongiaceae bacterium]
MADKEQMKEEAPPAAESTAAPPKKRKWTGKRIVLFVIVPLVLVLGGAGSMFALGLPPFTKATEPAKEEPPAAFIYYEMPEMLINLANSGKKAPFLKLKLQLAVDSADDQHKLETQLPLIIDQYQVYLRGLHAEDLQGSAGMQRLREELLLRVNLIVKPVAVHDVLFNQILIQ